MIFLWIATNHWHRCRTGQGIHAPYFFKANCPLLAICSWSICSLGVNSICRTIVIVRWIIVIIVSPSSSRLIVAAIVQPEVLDWGGGGPSSNSFGANLKPVDLQGVQSNHANGCIWFAVQVPQVCSPDWHMSKMHWCCHSLLLRFVILKHTCARAEVGIADRIVEFLVPKLHDSCPLRSGFATSTPREIHKLQWRYRYFYIRGNGILVQKIPHGWNFGPYVAVYR